MPSWLAKLLTDQLESLVRHSLSTIGGGLVVTGVASTHQAASVVGGVLAVGAVILSWVDKARKHEPVFTPDAPGAAAAGAAIEAEVKASHPLS